MKSFVYGSLALALLAGSSSVLAVTQPWSGLYAGVNAGGAWSGQSVSQSGYPSFGAKGPSSIADKPLGALGGFEANYNYGLSDKWIVGVAADYDWSNVYSNQSLDASAPGVTFTTTASQNLIGLSTLRVLFGYTPSTHPLLAYVTAGPAYGRLYNSGSISNPACTSFCASTDKYNSQYGWTAGAGVDYALTDAWVVKLEYLYYGLGSVTQSIRSPAYPGNYLNQQVSYQGNIIRAGVDYKFA